MVQLISCFRLTEAQVRAYGMNIGTPMTLSINTDMQDRWKKLTVTLTSTLKDLQPLVISESRPEIDQPYFLIHARL